jgi:hypothetical protein
MGLSVPDRDPAELCRDSFGRGIDVEHPVQLGAVDGGDGRACPAQDQVVGDVQISGGGRVLRRSGD